MTALAEDPFLDATPPDDVHLVGERATDTLSPEPPTGSGRKLSERFTSPPAILATLAVSIDWAWRGYIALGAITEVVGKAKAAGKTTFLAHLIRAMLDGRPFLDQPTVAGPIVLLTEQPPASLRAVLERADLGEREDLRVLLWRDVRGSRWPEIVAAAVAECQRIGSTTLVVDTLPAFAGVRGDSENDAGAALAAIEPLQLAAANGLAVLVVRHERKGGGEVGESGRGSTAFTGAVDVSLQLARQPTSVRPTIRILSALSRFDETPDELVVELTDRGYIAHGDQTAVAFDEARRAVLDVVPDPPAEGMTEVEIIAAVGGRKATVGTALRALLNVGEVMRTGEGRRGAPFVYVRTAADSRPVSPVPPSGRNGWEKPGRGLSVGGRTAEIFHQGPVHEPDDLVDQDAESVDLGATFPDPAEGLPWVN